MRFRVGFLLALAVSLVAASGLLARGLVEERYALVNESETRGFSPTLVAVLESPSEYVRESIGRLGNDGVWKGPHYQATARASLGGDATIDWSVLGVRAASARAAFLDNRAQDWPVIQEGTEPIERVVGGRPSGTVQASWLLTQAPPQAGEARYELGVVIPLCSRGVWAVVEFAALEPSGDSAGGTMGYGDYLVKSSVKPTVWNRDQLLAAVQGVTLEGNLPLAQLAAAGGARAVTGRLVDCNGAPLAGQIVRLERKSGRAWKPAATGRTTVSGTYTLSARPAGSYRVAAGSVRSATVRAGH